MSLELHRRVELLVDKAKTAKGAGNLGEVRQLSFQAAQLEESVFGMIPGSKPRTRAILGLSAVSLYWRAAEHTEVIRLGKQVLEAIDQGQQWVAPRIREMMTEAEHALRPPIDQTPT